LDKEKKILKIEYNIHMIVNLRYTIYSKIIKQIIIFDFNTNIKNEISLFIYISYKLPPRKKKLRTI